MHCSISRLAFVVCLCLVSAASDAFAERIESVVSCQRFTKLLSEADIARVVGKRPTAFQAGLADYVDECAIEVEFAEPPLKPAAVGPMSIRFKQHLSESDAGLSLGLMQRMTKGEEIIRSDRSLGYYNEKVWPAVNMAVDAAEVTINLRDKKMFNKSIATHLALLLHERALSSQDLIAHDRGLMDVRAYVSLTPLIKLAERCMEQDVPNHDAFKKAWSGSLFAKVRLPSPDAMSPYASDWLKQNRNQELLARKTAAINEPGNASQIYVECKKFEEQIPQMVREAPMGLLQPYLAN